MEIRRTPDTVVISRSPEIQTPIQYASDFAREARFAQKRVWVQCMDFEMGHAPGIVQNALRESAQRGVDSRLTIDGFATAMINDKVGIIPKFGENKAFQNVTKQADKDMFEGTDDDRSRLYKLGLKTSGVKLTVTNPKIARIVPADLFPFIGRNHMKITIVDDIAWFGGVNIASDHFEKADFMVKITDPEIVGALVEIFPQVNKRKPEKDFKKEINENYSVLVDRGERGKSIILDEALEMIHRVSETIQFISQLPPSGKVLDALLEQAKQGVDVDVITQAESNLNSNSIPFGLLMKRSYQSFLAKTKDFPNVRIHHFRDHHGKVHAKMLIVDEAEALWGSHNLDESGVRVGTQEVSMRTKDPKLILRLVAIFDQIKNGTYDLGFQEGPFNPQDFTGEESA